MGMKGLTQRPGFSWQCLGAITPHVRVHACSSEGCRGNRLFQLRGPRVAGSQRGIISSRDGRLPTGVSGKTELESSETV